MEDKTGPYRMEAIAGVNLDVETDNSAMLRRFYCCHR
jgi:hypothetical protein